MDGLGEYLCCAAEDGRLKEVKELLQRGVRPDHYKDQDWVS